MPHSSDDLFIQLSNYAEHQAALFAAIAAARISSADTNRYLDNTYGRELTYSVVPQWAKNGGIDEDDVTSDDGHVVFPATITMQYSGEGEGNVWRAKVASEASTSPATATATGGGTAKTSDAPAAAGPKITSRRRDELLRKQDPRYWFSSMPPKMITQTRDAWREVVKASMDLMRSKEASLKALAAYEGEE